MCGGAGGCRADLTLDRDARRAEKAGELLELGLSVVRWVAEAHGGTARLLESERGAAFEVSLPI